MLMPINIVSGLGVGALASAIPQTFAGFDPQITSTVLEIVAEEFEVEQDSLFPDLLFAKDDAHPEMENLGADSNAILSVIAAFEDEFGDAFEEAGIDEIPNEDYAKIPTLGAAIRYIEALKTS
jgi:acyl carrier protein